MIARSRRSSVTPSYARLVSGKSVSRLSLRVATVASAALIAAVTGPLAAARADVVRSAPTAEPTPSFRQEVLFSSTFKIAAARLALEKSQNPAVRQAAEAVIAQQVPLRNELLLNSHLLPAALPGGAQLPGGTNFTDRNRAAILQQLKDLDAAGFDAAFGPLMASAHDATLTLFTNYALYGDNGRMYVFANRALPKIKAAFERVQR
ncbi:DUF4142 domain-containing protein [Blastochloris sulfoviridis]|uniref:DUF4142 domain-containing protein n=1 Tax=Blastochloris sulfoviridis TaxID=50712 RepID=A0A5M6I419_9HYPH|nr:DUF4142 domain-containing protein [Blastochloris sulfoviridis]